MKVTDQLLVARAYVAPNRGASDSSRVIGASAPSIGPSTTSAATPTPKDRLEFSHTAQTLQRARAVIATLPDTRSAEVAAARAAIATGSFPPGAELIAAALYARGERL